MFSQPVPWNYVMLPPGMMQPPPPSTQADTLKAILSMAGKPQVPIESKPIVKKRVIHNVLKPPLYISTERREISPNVFAKEVTDPTVPESDEFRTYFLCGDCDSKRLFRKVASLVKHRQTAHEETQLVASENLDQLVVAARSTLESLSLEELQAECEKVQIFSKHVDKRELIEIYLSRITGVEATQAPSAIEDTQYIEVSFADQPPLPARELSLSDLSRKSSEILKRFPGISSGLLAIALVADAIPRESELDSIAIQTSQFTESIGIQTDTNPIPITSKRKPPEKTKIPKSKKPPPTSDRRSERLAFHYKKKKKRT